MLKPLFTLAFLLCGSATFAQQQPADSVRIVADSNTANFNIAPQFSGGTAEFRKFLANNVRYPLQAIRRRASGKTFVAFMVETDGTLSSTVTSKDSYGFAKEAIRVMQLSPKWQPGTSNGKKTKMRYSFSLDYNIIREGFVAVDINLPEDTL